MTKLELDLSCSRIYTEDDVADAISLIGQDVYMSNYIDFSVYSKNEFIGVNYVIDNSFSTLYPFICKGKDGNERSSYRYFILAKDAKFKEFKEEEKELRPFNSIEEFIEGTECEIGNLITFKRKDHSTEYNMLFAGYALTGDGEVLIYLGTKYYVLEELMNNFLYYRDGEWLPFGIEE